MSKQCELCARPARMYCESDHASLCWGCDAKVHGANFLVARHTRCLLCSSCQAPTPWRASGARLGPSFTTCQRCGGAGVEGDACGAEKGEGMGDRAWVEADTAGSGDLGGDDDEDEEEDGEEEEEEEGDSQVVPWSIEEVPAAATPPPVASCTSSEESSSGRLGIDQGFLKRRRGNTTLSTFYAANPMYVLAAGQPWAADLIPSDLVNLDVLNRRG